MSRGIPSLLLCSGLLVRNHHVETERTGPVGVVSEDVISCVRTHEERDVIFLIKIFRLTLTDGLRDDVSSAQWHLYKTITGEWICFAR